MSNVLFIINEEAHARELSRVADFLLKSGGPQPVYFVEERMKPFGVHTTLAATSIETLTADGFAAGERAEPLASQDDRRRRLSARLTRMRTALLLQLPAAARRVAGPLRRFASVEQLLGRLPNAINRYTEPLMLIAGLRDQIVRRYALNDAILAAKPYKAIVICEDNIEFDTAAWILAAQQRGIRCVIIPYTVANTVELTEAYVFSKPLQLRASAFNRVVAWLLPKWCAHHKGRSFLRAHPARIAAIELLGLAPPNPFLLNSGAADAIAVESIAMHDYYSEAGIPQQQLVLTGTLVDDLMAAVKADAANLRRALLEENGLPQDRPVLLCAFPPDQGVFDRPGCDFKDFDDMIRYWGQRLGEVKGWNVIVARHPKTRPGRLDALRQFGLTLTDRDTASIIPLCDLYVASVSATIRWAIACGKPVINYDAYRLDFQDYPNVEAVVWSNTRKEFERTLTEATADPAHFARLQAAQQREAPRWGFHDGRSGQRLRALLSGEPFGQPVLDPGPGRG